MANRRGFASGFFLFANGGGSKDSAGGATASNKRIRNTLQLSSSDHSLGVESADSRTRPRSAPLSNQSSVESGGSGQDDRRTVVSSSAGSSASSPGSSPPSTPTGPKYKMVHEGDIQVCRLTHSRSVVNKIMCSKLLRRWEKHHLVLTATGIISKTATGYMEEEVPYTSIEDISILPRTDVCHSYCVRIAIPDGSLLLQAKNDYVRGQWLHSMAWKKNVLKYKKLLTNSSRPEILLKELKNMIEMSVNTPLQDDCIFHTPLDIISRLLRENTSEILNSEPEEVINAVSPLLEMTTPTAEICDFYCKFCETNPRSMVVMEKFTPVVNRILKHSMDFGKHPKTRLLVQVYVEALSSYNDGKNVLQKFIDNVHGQCCTCPHPRILPNLVSVCLAAIYSVYEQRKRSMSTHQNENLAAQDSEWETRLICFISILEILAKYEDWRPSLAQLLQPIPFPDEALADSLFTSNFKPVLEEIAVDSRCEVHLALLGIRADKEGWLPLYCPGSIPCDDEGDLWSKMIQQLLSCCCRRKRFLESMQKSLGPCMLRALRGDETMQSVLCSMLEFEVVADRDLQLQLITTLQSTETGKKLYSGLCQRQRHLKELQRKGGPRKLTLPSRSTDADVAKLLSSGSFGNLECLSLAFTQVTSACAEHLVKLPSLKYLNLWSTQFDDSGLQLLSDHLQKLQVLNLCETPVTDKGLSCLTAMKHLRKLNLNSTRLSAQTFEKLKRKLPSLQECDIRYTDAW